MISLISTVLILDIFEIFLIYDKNYEETLKEMHPINLDRSVDNFLLPILTLLGFSVLLLIFGGINFSDPREYYRTLISFNTNNSSFLRSISFPLLAILASYLSSFAYSLKNLTFVISFTFLLGSKGLVAVPFFVFSYYNFLFRKKLRILFIFIGIFVLLYILPIYLNKLHGYGNILEWLASYSDYMRNINNIEENLPIFPQSI